MQLRGGPESQMSTSWVQIVQLRPSDAGIYSCIATNEKGTTRAVALVDIAGNVLCLVKFDKKQVIQFFS